jgi:hypothetical protein
MLKKLYKYLHILIFLSLCLVVTSLVFKLQILTIYAMLIMFGFGIINFLFSILLTVISPFLLFKNFKNKKITQKLKMKNFKN